MARVDFPALGGIDDFAVGARILEKHALGVFHEEPEEFVDQQVNFG